MDTFIMRAPTLLPLSHLLLLSVIPHGMEFPFDWFKPLVLVMSAPYLLSTPRLLVLGAFGESLDAMAVLFSSRQNIGVISGLFYLQVQSKTLYELLQGKLGHLSQTHRKEEQIKVMLFSLLLKE